MLGHQAEQEGNDETGRTKGTAERRASAAEGERGGRGHRANSSAAAVCTFGGRGGREEGEGAEARAAAAVAAAAAAAAAATVGPFEMSLGRFYKGRVVPSVAGWFGEINKDFDQTIATLAKETAASNFEECCRHWSTQRRKEEPCPSCYSSSGEQLEYKLLEATQC